MSNFDKINEEYFNWMFNVVAINKNGRIMDKYTKLLSQLHNTDFIYSLPMDYNRKRDGVDLKYRFGDEYNYSDCEISEHLNGDKCSVLEMMVSLSIRCEENIMDDPDIGDRTGTWFWGMISNLGLYSMDDKNYNKKYVDDIIDTFLDRKYKPNGSGGLFTVKRYRDDLRVVEIWYQLCWYLDELI